MSAVAHMACSTCDDYELVPGPDGFHLVRCPDCAFHCPVHGEPIVVGGHCLGCLREANMATDLLTRAQCVLLKIGTAA